MRGVRRASGLVLSLHWARRISLGYAHRLLIGCYLLANGGLWLWLALGKYLQDFSYHTRPLFDFHVRRPSWQAHDPLMFWFWGVDHCSCCNSKTIVSMSVGSVSLDTITSAIICSVLEGIGVLLYLVWWRLSDKKKGFDHQGWTRSVKIISQRVNDVEPPYNPMSLTSEILHDFFPCWPRPNPSMHENIYMDCFLFQVQCKLRGLPSTVEDRTGMGREHLPTCECPHAMVYREKYV